MKVGTRVELMGVHRRVYETRTLTKPVPVIGEDGEPVEGEWTDQEYEEQVLVDGPREGRPAVYVGEEPAGRFGEPNRLILRLDNRAVVTVDAADVKRVATADDESIAFAQEVVQDG